MLQADREAFLRLIETGYFVERLQLARLSPLAIIHMKECQAVLLVCYRGRNAAVHATAYEHHSQILFHEVSLPVSVRKFYGFLNIPGYGERKTPME
jgi:hypothetical protein